jgi:RHS repeat-associated protein
VSVWSYVPNSFKYDPFGHRIYKSSSSGTSIYAYDGDNLVEETNSAGAVVARYSQGLNIDEPLAMLRSSATSYYNADGLGSITSLSNAAGALAQTYAFDSFGKQTASSGSLKNPFQYTARESDSETGLYYYRARYYNPQLQRFISEDPLGFAGGDVNLYAYVNGNPIGFRDPFGLCPPTRNQRLKLAAKGAFNLGVGLLKTAGGVALTMETGGLAVGIGVYAVGTGMGNIYGGFAQIGGALTGDVESGERGGDAMAAIGSVSGLTILAVNGVSDSSMATAATAGKIEGLAVPAFLLGLGEAPMIGEYLEGVQSGGELLGKGNDNQSKPGMANPKCPTKCPQ